MTVRSCGSNTEAPIEEVKAKADAGDAKSQVEFGRRYDKGEGVVKDHAEAAKWYRKAAEQNLAVASIQFGHVLRTGRPVDGGLGRGLQVALAGSEARP